MTKRRGLGLKTALFAGLVGFLSAPPAQAEGPEAVVVSDAGGTITVTAWIADEADGGPVGLAIRDEGKGMSPALQARVFEPFMTTKGSGAGTGLGLAVVHGLVTSRGGHVDIESAEGEGTTVTLLLPVVDADEVSGSLPVAGIAAPAPRGTRLLLVEDEPALRRFLSRALERRSFEGEDWVRSKAGADPAERLRDNQRDGIDVAGAIVSRAERLAKKERG